MTATIEGAVSAAASLYGRLLVEAASPFVDAATYVLSHQCHEDIHRGELSTVRTVVTRSEVNIAVAVTGEEIAGVVLYGATEKAARRLVAPMLEQLNPKLDSMALSALLELANMVTGQATTRLQEGGFATELSPPQMILGKSRFLAAKPITFLRVPLELSVGVWNVDIGLRQRGGWAS